MLQCTPKSLQENEQRRRIQCNELKENDHRWHLSDKLDVLQNSELMFDLSELFESSAHHRTLLNKGLG